MKKSLKSQDSENAVQKTDPNHLRKNFKSKEKEFFSLDTKVDNLSSNCKALKTEIEKL